MGETDRRRAIQEAYNEANGITPESIVRPLDMSLARIIEADYTDLTGGEARACRNSSRRKSWTSMCAS
jgi:excinuclease UvrABC helicase subunit UvrB